MRVVRAESGDSYGDISVDLERSRAVFREWLERARDAYDTSPDGTRRPFWLIRPLKPARDVYRLPERVGAPDA